MGKTEQEICFNLGKLKGQPVKSADTNYLKWFYQMAAAGTVYDSYLVQKEVAQLLGYEFLFGKDVDGEIRLSCGKYRKCPLNTIPLSYLKWYYANCIEECEIREAVAALLGIPHEELAPEVLTEKLGWEVDDVKF